MAINMEVDDNQKVPKYNRVRVGADGKYRDGQHKYPYRYTEELLKGHLPKKRCKF